MTTKFKIHSNSRHESKKFSPEHTLCLLRWLDAELTNVVLRHLLAPPPGWGDPVARFQHLHAEVTVHPSFHSFTLKISTEHRPSVTVQKKREGGEKGLCRLNTKDWTIDPSGTLNIKMFLSNSWVQYWLHAPGCSVWSEPHNDRFWTPVMIYSRNCCVKI